MRFPSGLGPASILCAALLAAPACGTESSATGVPFTKLFSLSGEYPLGAEVDRTDYESIDATAQRLYISKMGGGQLLVFDLARNRLVA